MRVAMGSLFIVWPRNRIDPLTGSHNGQRSAHRGTRDEACLANESDVLEIYERIDLRRRWGDFGGLQMGRNEGRVVDPPLVFKRGFLGDERGAMRLEPRERRDLKRSDSESEGDFFGRKDTMNAGGVGELETTS
ncbi:hypothetical protein TNCV_1989341 [Trichonephila clavipes]|nr:hypothetical protein TNCV_1989341 [Trichonephila clavipes]